MRERSGWRTKAPVLSPVILAAVLLAVGLGTSALVLEITGLGLHVPVSEGDVITRTYTQSMYHVPVSEKLRIEGGRFRLVHVNTPSEAVLAYLGLESKDEPNADLTLDQFTIPAGSTGNHVLRVHDRDIPLGTREGQGGKIHVKLVEVSLLVYFAHLLAWR